MEPLHSDKGNSGGTDRGCSPSFLTQLTLNIPKLPKSRVVSSCVTSGNITGTAGDILPKQSRNNYGHD